MTKERKTELISQLVSILNEFIETAPAPVEETKQKPVEMLTIKECAAQIKGLSEHTVRKLIAQNKLPCVRTGEGKRGKMLVNKAELIEYFSH